jgi:hypothetical protein
MTSVIRPAGPLPQRVYWVRRLLVLAIVLVAVALSWSAVGHVLGGAESPAQSAGISGDGQPPTPPDDGSGTGVGSGTGQGANDQTGSQNPAKNGPDKNGPDKNDKNDKNGKGSHAGGGKPALSPPTGDCAPADVGLRLVVDDSRSGAGNPITLKFTSLATAACTLAITPDSLVLRITSGSDVIWTSDDCPDDLLAKELVVRERPATAYTFAWNGYRSTESCNAPGSVASAGGYWAEAALVGADAHRGYFDIR